MLDDTKKQLTEAVSSGNSDLVEQLQGQLKKTDTDLIESLKKIKELELQLKEKPIETTATVTTEVIEKVPDDVQKELEELRKKVDQPVNTAALKFKVYFEELVKNFQSLLGTLAEIADPEENERYKKAVSGLIGKMSERL